MTKAKRYGDGPIHRQVELTVNGETITCDRCIAPLIRELREAGFRTLFSCQGSWGYDLPYVALEKTGDLEEMRRIIRRFWPNCVIYETPWMDGRLTFHVLKSRFQIKNHRRFDTSFIYSNVIAGGEMIKESHEQQ